MYCCVGGHIVRIRIVHKTEKWVRFLRKGRHRNRGSLRIFVVEGNSYRTGHTKIDWHDFQGAIFLGGWYSSTDLAHFSRNFFGGIVWVL